MRISAVGNFFSTRMAVGAELILRAVEDDLQFVDCMSGDCKCKKPCQSFVVWENLYKSINNCLDSITLDSLIKGDK